MLVRKINSVLQFIICTICSTFPIVLDFLEEDESGHFSEPSRIVWYADGICHLYVDKSANMDMAKKIVLDAKLDYPAACNAMVIICTFQFLDYNFR